MIIEVDTRLSSRYVKTNRRRGSSSARLFRKLGSFHLPWSTGFWVRAIGIDPMSMYSYNYDRPFGLTISPSLCERSVASSPLSFLAYHSSIILTSLSFPTQESIIYGHGHAENDRMEDPCMKQVELHLWKRAANAFAS
mmetsp:Transcript_17012/g.35501  ORF Transcript_17012/g.35501 Transcript_17012/m.35501 type:complete len:138 (-) Transcript_17012:59-472(-)